MKTENIGWIKIMKGTDDIKRPSVVQSPWVTTAQLTPWIEVKKWAGWSKMLFFNRPASDWTWLQTFTGFWFTPTSYKIVCTGATSTSSTDVLFSVWAYQADNNKYCSWQQWTASNYDYWTSSTTYVCRVINTSGSTRTSAYHNACITDWIELNFNFSWYDVILEITAYK